MSRWRRATTTASADGGGRDGGREDAGRGEPGQVTGRSSADTEILAVYAERCRAIAAGDLETRLPFRDGASQEVLAIRNAVNHLVDVIDAFVRESGATMTAASEGRFYRRFLARGMPGSFALGARRIDEGRRRMADAEAAVAAERDARGLLVEELSEVSEHAASAAVQLGASASALTGAAQAAEDRAQASMGVVGELESSSRTVADTAQLIKAVANQTRLLALNATIEAARAGQAGRGFAVVANEVKSLSDSTRESSEEIERQIGQAQEVAARAVEAMRAITDVVAEMRVQIEGIHQAAAGGEGLTGLAQLAETLRIEVGTLAQR